MRRLARLLGWLVLAGIAAPGAATAAPRALLDAPRAGDLALAGGEVLVSSAVSGGEARLTAVPLDGGPAREAFRARPPGRGAWISSTRLASSDRLTAMLVEFTDPEGNPRDWRVYAGPPSGPLAIAHRARLVRAEPLWIPIEIDVHGDRLLVQELRLPLGGRAQRLRFRLTVHAPGVTSAPVPQLGYGSPAVVAGDWVAHLARRRPPLIRIVGWRTGRLSGTIGLGRASGEIMERHLDLAEDGRAVVALDGELFTGAPGERARPLPGTAGARDLSAPRFTRERVAALIEARRDTRRPVVIDPLAATLRPIGPPSTALTSLSADERTVAWLANGCVVAAGVDDVAPGAVLPSGPCPRAEVVLEEHDQKLRGRTLRVRVTCVAAPPPGCRGAATLGSGGRAGEGRFRVPAGESRLVGVRLSKRGMASLRRQLGYDAVALLRLGARVADGRVSREAGPGWVLVDPPG